MKVLFADYEHGYSIIEFIGEWNDALHNRYYAPEKRDTGAYDG